MLRGGGANIFATEPSSGNSRNNRTFPKVYKLVAKHLCFIMLSIKASGVNVSRNGHKSWPKAKTFFASSTPSLPRPCTSN